MVWFSNNITVEDFNSLRKSVGWEVIEYKQAEVGLKNSTFITVAKIDTKVVGVARVISDGGYVAIIVDVIVDPEFQRQGIGGRLLENIMKYLELSISDGQLLKVNLMATTGKEEFYKKYGFITRPNENMGSGMIKIIKK